MKVAIYARVSTSDKDQNTETQLLPLRDFCLPQGWEVYREYLDQAPANDLLHRVQWRQLLDDAAKLRFSLRRMKKIRNGKPELLACSGGTRPARQQFQQGLLFRSIEKLCVHVGVQSLDCRLCA